MTETETTGRITEKSKRHAHPWPNLVPIVPSWRVATTLLDRCGDALWVHINRQEGIEGICGARSRIVRAWRSGFRRTPMWVLDRVQVELRARAERLLALSAEIDRERAERIARGDKH